LSNEQLLIFFYGVSFTISRGHCINSLSLGFRLIILMEANHNHAEQNAEQNDAIHKSIPARNELDWRNVQPSI